MRLKSDISEDDRKKLEGPLFNSDEAQRPRRSEWGNFDGCMHHLSFHLHTFTILWLMTSLALKLVVKSTRGE